MSAYSTIRVGIVGLGNIGLHHADRLVDHGVPLVGGMDINPEARSRFETQYDVPTFADHHELYDNVEAVVITTPNKFHEEYTTAALEAGLDVLLEKPLAHDLESARRIAAAARDSEGFCMVGFNNRFRSAIEVLKAQQSEGRFGDVHHVEANYVRRRGIPGRGSWFTSSVVAGGGALIDIGVHALDLALHVLDYPEVVEVSGITRSTFGQREDYAYLEMWGEDTGGENFDVEDSASAFVRCADGRTISLEAAWAANRPLNDEFVIHGTEAGATFDRGNGTLTVFEADKTGADHFANTEINTRERDTHSAEQELFLTAVRDGLAPERNSVEQALTVQRVIDAIYRSSEQGEAVKIDDESAENPARNVD